jgi:hypothetical protein
MSVIMYASDFKLDEDCLKLLNGCPVCSKTEVPDFSAELLTELNILRTTPLGYYYE